MLDKRNIGACGLRRCSNALTAACSVLRAFFASHAGACPSETLAETLPRMCGRLDPLVYTIVQSMSPNGSSRFRRLWRLEPESRAVSEPVSLDLPSSRQWRACRAFRHLADRGRHSWRELLQYLRVGVANGAAAADSRPRFGHRSSTSFQSA